MGVNFSQYCILGVKIDCELIKTITSPKVVEDHPRYDTRTGKVVGHDQVLVKSEESHYSYFGISDEDLYSLQYKLEACLRSGISVILNRDEHDNDKEFLYIGIKIGEDYDMGRVDMIHGEVSIDELTAHVEDLCEELKYDKSRLSLHFLYDVG